LHAELARRQYARYCSIAIAQIEAWGLPGRGGVKVLNKKRKNG